MLPDSFLSLVSACLRQIGLSAFATFGLGLLHLVVMAVFADAAVAGVVALSAAAAAASASFLPLPIFFDLLTGALD